MASKGFFHIFVFLLYLGLGLYFINAPFKFIPSLPSVNDWSVFVGGVLLIFGGMKSIVSGKKVSKSGSAE